MIDASSIPPEKRLDYLDQQLNQKRQVKLKTCADVYNYWRSCKRLYKKAPKDGVEFQIDYIDTGLALDERIRSSAPIALALHGAPGSYHDFALLIHHLTQQNVRVIAPNFPEYVATVKTKVLFRHSADEKAAYLRDFLKAINVSKIDLLVSHSSAIFPTLLILLNANQQAIARQQRQQAEHECKQSSQQSHRQDDRAVITNNKSNPLQDVTSNGTNLDSDSLNGYDTADEDEYDENEPAKTALATEGVHTNGDVIVEIVDKNSPVVDSYDAHQEIDGNNNSRNCENQVENPTQTNNGTRDSDKPARAKSERRTNKRSSKSRRHRNDSQEPIVKFDQPIEIKAVALFNPAGHRLPKSMKPTWFKCGSVHIYQHKLGRSLFRKLGPAFLTVIGVPVKVDNMDNVMLSATVMRNSKCQRVVQQLEQLSQMQLPTLLVFSENDKLIEKEIFYEMTQFMKLDQKNFDIFNNDGDIELSQSSRDDWIRVMVFKAGGHYAYSNYAKTVNKAVSELLRKVTKNESAD